MACLHLPLSYSDREAEVLAGRGMKENNVCGAGKESKPVCLLSGPRGHLANLHACLAGCVASLPPGPLLRFCSEDLGPEHSRLESPASLHLSGTTLFFCGVLFV